MLILENSYADKQRNIKQQVHSCIPLCAIASPLLCTMCTENKHSSVYRKGKYKTITISFQELMYKACVK